MNENNDGLKKTEELYLQIFKVTIIVALSISLVASVIMLIIGANGYLFSAPTKPMPAQVAPPPKIEVQGFVQSFVASEKPSPVPTAAPALVKPKGITPNHALTPSSDSLEKIWGYADQYQRKCNLPVQMSKDQFLKKIKELTGSPRALNLEFINSQDAFIKALLEDPATVELGKSQTVVTKIVAAAMAWHAKEWHRQIEEGRHFEAREAVRVAQFLAEENLRAASKKVFMGTMLLGSLWAFGVFLALALILIFSKIETNLREIKQELAAKNN